MRALKTFAVSVWDNVRGIKASTWRVLAMMFVLYVLPVVLFVALVDEVLENDTLPYDDAILQFVHGFHAPWLDPIVVAITNIGGPVGATLLTGVIALAFLAYRQRRKFLIVVAGVGGATLLNILLKALFQRDRPQLWERIVTENSFSFPSGHAMASSALALSLIAIFWPTRWRWWAIAASVGYMVIIGSTRLYLGVHYPTDIIAGWLVSATWVALVSFYCIKWRRKPQRA